MEKLNFSFIIPVYNRPNEIEELLRSFTSLKTDEAYEIVIIEDGSSLRADEVVKAFQSQLNISYYFKANSGPGDSRNYGMKKARGNYFIILDSDVILPPQYLNEVITFLNKTYFDCFGGPDAAHPDFNSQQKAVSFAMTSFLTTGGIRGGKKHLENFQPRSFNMGLSKAAFLATGGFGDIHPGEDPDLSLRLQRLGFKTTLIPKAFVYHKRRISWSKFYHQVYKFGIARPILNVWHPKSRSVIYWFPTVFILGFIVALVLLSIGFPQLAYLYSLYFATGFVWASISNKSVIVGIKAVVAIFIQFFGYGYGFIKSTLKVVIFKQSPELVFPHMFFK